MVLCIGSTIGECVVLIGFLRIGIRADLDNNNKRSSSSTKLVS